MGCQLYYKIDSVARYISYGAIYRLRLRFVQSFTKPFCRQIILIVKLITLNERNYNPQDHIYTSFSVSYPP